MRLLVARRRLRGKTTACRHLREVWGVNAVDTNDEILRLNGGVWPSIDRKNEVLLPTVIDAAVATARIILFNSYMPAAHLARLREAGFRTALLEVSEAALRRRHAVRYAVEGWTNVEWIDWNRAHLAELRNDPGFDAVIAGEREVAAVAADILAAAR